MLACTPLILSFLPALSIASPLQEAVAEKAPTGKALTKLISSLYDVRTYRRTSRQDLDALLEPYRALDAPEGSDRKTLLKKVEKAWGKLRKLPKKGEHWYWDEKKARRGRFFVSGKTSKPKGLFIGLHGGGVGSANTQGALNAYQGPAGSRGWLSIYPQAIEATECGWTDTGTEEWIMTLIDEARRTYRIPVDRIYIGGHSMGGYGSWVLGAHHADLFAAAVPSAGAPTPIKDRATEKIVAIQEGVVPNLLNLPMCVFQSTDDPKVPPDANQFAVAELSGFKETYGGYEDFEYWEVSDRGHGYPTGGTDKLLERIEDYERRPHPDHVLWQPALDWRTSFYWLDWPKPRIGALIDARLDRASNRIDVKSDGKSVKGLGVLLSPAVVDMEKDVVITLNGEEVFRSVPKTSWATLVRTALVQDEGRLYEARVPLK
ncbi:MAG: hypothetical protein AAGG01_16685 [Planctomycetota bacterium]